MSTHGGLTASVVVRQDDFHAALRAISKHVAPVEDVISLQHVQVRIDPDRMMYLAATDRYTAALAAVSVWDDLLETGEPAEFYLSGAKDVPDLITVFKPGKGGDSEDSIRIDVAKGRLSLKLVRGMIELPGDRTLEICPAEIDEYPDVHRVIAGSITRAIALREAAEDAGSVDSAVVDEVFASPQMLGRFAEASAAYGRAPLILQRTAEARSAMLVTVSESFVGLLMPVRPAEDAVTDHREWQAAWLRRLPLPLPVPVAMPEKPADEDDGAEDEQVETTPEGQTVLPVSDGERTDQELVALAAELVVATQLVSTSMLQRKLRVGYAAAEVLMNVLKRLAVVVMPDGGKSWEVVPDADDAAEIAAFLRDWQPAGELPECPVTDCLWTAAPAREDEEFGNTVDHLIDLHELGWLQAAQLVALRELARPEGALVTDVGSLEQVDLRHGTGVVFSEPTP